MPNLTPANLEARRGRVGASEVAALLPEIGHPFATPGSVWARIVLGNQNQENQAMYFGSELEDVILRLGADRLDVHARASRRTFVHPAVPLAATPDALVIRSRDLIEVKLVGHYAATDHWQYGPPAHVLAQVQTQLLLTKRERCHVVALLGGLKLVTHTIEADPDQQAAVVQAVRLFDTQHLQTRIPPPDLDPELWLTVNVPEGTHPADGGALEIGDRLAATVEMRSDLEKLEKELRGEISREMVIRDAAILTADGWTATAVTYAKTGKTGLTFRRKRVRSPVHGELKRDISEAR